MDERCVLNHTDGGAKVLERQPKRRVYIPAVSGCCNCGAPV